MYKRTQNSFLASGLIGYDSTAIIHEPFIVGNVERIVRALSMPGIHHLRFVDLASSRLVLNTHLRYSNKIVGHLFLPHPTLSSFHIDLYSLFSNYAYLPHNLDEFFIDYTHIELLWIEQSTALLATAWFPVLEKSMLDFNIQNIIPIIVASYDA